MLAGVRCLELESESAPSHEADGVEYWVDTNYSSAGDPRPALQPNEERRDEALVPTNEETHVRFVALNGPCRWASPAFDPERTSRWPRAAS